MNRYDDIINLEPPVSKKHPPMDRLSRAAQFSPFAALTGHSEAIRKTEQDFCVEPSVQKTDEE